MGAFFAYTVYSGIFLLAGLILYKWIMAPEKQYAVNRYTLLGIYALSFAALPLSHIRFGATVTPVSTLETGELQLLSATGQPVPLWPKVLLIVYLAGVAAVLAWTFVVAFRLIAIIRSGRHYRNEDYTLIIVSHYNVAPFSWGRYIVMSKADYNSSAELITAHERAHIRYGHYCDLIMAQIVCIILWYNPASWLMREELKSIHEYQADGAVIASGVDARQYQMLLIKKAVGTRFQSLANSLNHSKLKKRITMMYKEKNRGLRRLRGLALGLAPVIALTVVNIPAVASAISGLGKASVELSVGAPAVTSGKVSENHSFSETPKTGMNADKIAKIASFPGGEAEMFKYLAYNVKYPEAAQKKNMQGRAVIGFVVETDGSLSQFKVLKSAGEELDKEAIRVISSMPKWNPAVTKEGTKIASQYALPIHFSLTTGADTPAEEKPADSPAKEKTADAGAKTLEEIKVVGYGAPKN